MAGTSFVALEERLLLAAQPVVEVTGGDAPIGGQAQITLTFDNTAVPGTSNIGYAPFVDLVLPRRGVDGVAPGTGPNQTYDGMEFVSASYLGVQLKATKLVFDANGDATHPFLRVENTNTPLVVKAATFKLDGVGDPNARAGAGDQLIVLELPFGSFAPEQPKATVNVTAKVSNFADQDKPLPVVARGGFAFGTNPLDDPATDHPFVGAVASNTVTPSVLTVSKTFDWKENETATGPNFVRNFTIRLDVVTGQTVSAISLVDRLPNGIVVVGTPTLSVLGVSVPTNAPIYDPLNHSVTAEIPGPLTGVNNAEVTMTVPFYVQDTLAPGDAANPVLNPDTGAPRDLHNHVRAEATWLPLDPRDRNPGNLPIRIELDPDRVEATVTAKSVATQKSQIILSDLAPTGLGPNDIIRYTVDVQVSDYFRLGSVVLTDKLSDGQAFLPESARLRVIEGGTVLGSMDILDPVNLFNTGNPSITPPPRAANGETTLTFNISAELERRGVDGLLFGGRVISNTAGGTTLQLVYDAVVERSYVGTTEPLTGFLNQGDRLSNSVRVDAVVLDSSDARTGDTFDTSASSGAIAVGSASKSVHAVNGVAPVGQAQVTSGDTVTFRLRYELPLTATKNLTITDFLPLPIFDAAPASWTFLDDVGTEPLAPYQVTWGPLATSFRAIFSPDPSNPRQPTMSASDTGNSITFGFGALSADPVQSTTVDLLFSVKVTDQPFGDGLLFTNVLEATERNTRNDPTTRVGLVQVLVNEPDLKIYKGVVATDRSTGQFPQAAFLPGDVGPANVTFQAPGSAGSSTAGRAAAFSNTIYSDGLASRPISSDIINLDAGDRVTFAIVVENTGNGPRGAFDVTIKDRLPNGFLIPTMGAGLNLRVTDGIGTTTLAHTVIGGGLFGTAAGDGIRVNDIDTDSHPTTFELGGLARYDATNGRNIVVITYDLIVDELAEARQVLRNAAEITRYAALEGGTNRAPTEPPSDMKADATATIWRPTITKVVSSTSEPSTTSSQGDTNIVDAAIGETVDYRIVITLQEGTTKGLKLTDFVQLGNVPSETGPGRLELIHAEVTHIGGDLYRARTDPSSPLERLPKPAPVFSDATTDNDTFNDQVVFDFGNVLNLPNNQQTVDDTITVTVRARVLNVEDNEAGDRLRNTAQLNFRTGGGGSDNISATADIEVVEPRLRIDKSAPPAFVLPGEVVTYTLTVTNDRPIVNGMLFAATAHRVVLTDRLLDPYLELIPGSVEGPTGSSVRPTTDGSLEVALAALAPGASATVKFKALVLATTPAAVTLENTASVSFSSLPGVGDTPDPHARTGSDSDTVRVPVRPSLTKDIVFTSNPDTGMGVGDPNLPDLAVGERVTYLLTITLPQGTTQNLVLSDTLPSGLERIGPVRVLPLGSGLTTDTQTTTINGQLITVNFSTVQNGSGPAVDAADVIRVEVDARVTGTALINAAGLSFTIGGRNGTLAASAPAEPVSPALTIGKTVAGISGDAGDLFTYTVTVAHGAASQMPGYDITVQDTLDPRLVPVAVSSTLGMAAISGQEVTLNLARLAQNEQAVVTYTVRFADTVQPGQLIGNTATLRYDSNPGPGGAPGTGSASAPDLLVHMPIALTKAIVATSLPETGSAFFNPALPDIAVGETVTYRLTATLSEGTQTLVIADTLPAGLVAEGATLISVGAGITAPAPVITLGGQAVRFDFGTVVNTGSVVGGDDVVVQVVARLAPVVAAGTPLTNAAVATVEGPDVPNSTLRAEAFAVAEVVAPQLVLAKAADLQLVAMGNTVGYTLTLAHAPGSSGPAYDVVIADPLSDPAVRLVAGSVATSSGSVTLGNVAGDSAIRVAVPVLLPGQVVTIGFRALAVSAPTPDGVVPNIGSFNAVSAPGVLPPGFDRPLSGSADAFVRIGAGGLPPYSLVTEGMFSGYADEFRRLRENAFTAPAIFAGSSQPGAAVMLHLRDSEGGPITMMGVVADIGGHWIANPMQSGISGPADPNGLQLVRGLAGRPEGEDTILPPPPPPRPTPTPTTMPYTLLADHTPASFDTRGTNTDVARLTFAGSIQPGGLFAGSPEAPGIAAAGAVGAALQKDLRGLAAPMSLGWNRFALDFAAATAAASVAGR